MDSPSVEAIAVTASGLLAFVQRAPLTAPIARYIKSSHQNDPFRTLLELLLVFFVIRTWRQRRTPGDASRGLIKLSKREVDELIDEWQPEPLVDDDANARRHARRRPPCIAVGEPGVRTDVIKAGTLEKYDTVSVLNLSSQNFAGLLGHPRIKDRAIQQLRRSGVGSCGPPGFYGTYDVHMELERDIASFLGTPSSIIYAQAFSTSSSVIPAFSKRGDIIVADRGINFAIQKGIQISRSTVRWFDHNNVESLEAVLKGIRRDDVRYRRKLSRRFIITEAIFERDGQMCDLVKIIELKKKYKFRLILDETWSIGAIGRTGRGLTEYLDVPATEIDMLLGSLATSFTSGGGFCAGSAEVVAHQRINSAALVFSAALPPLLATAASEAISILSEDGPQGGVVRMQTLQRHISTFRLNLTTTQHDSIISIPSHFASPMIHLTLGSSFGNLTVEDQQNILADVVQHCFDNGVLICEAMRVWEQEVETTSPSLRVCLSSGMEESDVIQSATIVRNAFDISFQKNLIRN